MAELHQYALRIDGPLLRKQREALLDVLHLKLAEETYEGLNGVLVLLDEIADQAHDQHGIDSLLEQEAKEGPDDHNRYRCECELPGHFCCGVPGILAHLENGRLPEGAKVERCDLCRRYPCDQAALERLRELGYAQS
jgi:hypothetical protein